MCKCKNTDGFREALRNAKNLDLKTGKKHAVYIKNKTAFVGELNTVKKTEGICCYFLSNGKEVLIEPKVKQEVQPKQKETTSK
ncbi:hypothetical protein HX001_14455 [Empedobacter brevis]|uniref:Uncharacterized protein n=1 Tax=Empedobacter brevis TaxID=247 RepID=A0AAJ1QGJ3_9FLAO|nr:hypothetical protein [Empedobacter brevis]MDM1073688.1 hypothetical protein [Empedobacter brevis]